MGKLLLNFGAKFQRKFMIYIQDSVEVLTCYEENLITRKSTSKSILKGVLSKNSETCEHKQKTML